MEVRMTMEEYKELEASQKYLRSLIQKIKDCAEYKESGILTVNQEKILELVSEIVEDC